MNTKVVATEINDFYILSSLLSRSICYFNTVHYDHNNWNITLSVPNYTGERHLSVLTIRDINQYDAHKMTNMMCSLDAITTDHNRITLHTSAESINFYVSRHYIELTINEDSLV